MAAPEFDRRTFNKMNWKYQLERGPLENSQILKLENNRNLVFYIPDLEENPQKQFSYQIGLQAKLTGTLWPVDIFMVSSNYLGEVYINLLTVKRSGRYFPEASEYVYFDITGKRLPDNKKPLVLFSRIESTYNEQVASNMRKALESQGIIRKSHLPARIDAEATLRYFFGLVARKSTNRLAKISLKELIQI